MKRIPAHIAIILAALSTVPPWAIAGAVAATGIVCLTTSKVVLSIYEEPVAVDSDVAPEVGASRN